MTLEDIADIVQKAPYGMLATCAEGQPRVRPLAFKLQPDGCLWSSTWSCSGKVAELEQNARVEVAFVGAGKVQLRVVGTVDLSGGASEKESLLEQNPKVRNHFSGGDDPNFVHISVVPTRFRVKPPGFNEYEELVIE